VLASRHDRAGHGRRTSLDTVGGVCGIIVVPLSPKQGRAVSRMLLAGWAAVMVSWMGLAALVALSILWPANQVPHVLLGVYLCAIVAQCTWPSRFTQSCDLPWRIVFAPAALPNSLFRAGRRVLRALGL
jgi:hypothetical protein